MQGFQNGAVGAAASYFASMGISKILKQSPANTSPEEAEQKTVQALEVAESDNALRAATTPDGRRTVPIRGNSGVGAPRVGLRNEKAADLLQNMGRFLTERQRLFGERNNGPYKYFCDEWRCPDNNRFFFVKPGSPNPCYCVRGKEYLLIY